MSSKLGQLQQFPFTVGPMVGLTHLAFRELICDFFPNDFRPLLFTEMLSTLRLPSERFDVAEELRTTAVERGYLIPQILGNQGDFIRKSLTKLQLLEPWGIDINMGCPVKKTLRHNWGVKLMGDPRYAAEVVKTARDSFNGPLSVKLRCGLDKADDVFIADFTAAIEEAGADWISVHARLKADKHKGKPNFALVSRLKTKRKIPIFGNGGIQNLNDAKAVVEDHGLDGAMIGRAATARPWLLAQIAYDRGFAEFVNPLGETKAIPPQNLEEEGLLYLWSMERLCHHLDATCNSDQSRMKKFRFYITMSHRWLKFGNAFYRRCMKVKAWPEMSSMIKDYRQSLVSFPMLERISLLQ